MLRILIIDDEEPARARLRRMLGSLPDNRVVGEAASGEEALQAIERHRPDALLLDISMPGLDGVSLARTLQDQRPAPAVIFCTAWSDRAVDAFECDAADYLVKPVRAERLQAALDKVRRLAARTADEPEEAFLYSTVGGRKTLIPLDEVACLVSEDKYTTVIHDRGKAVINDSLVEIEKRHGDRFLRVHRGVLVARRRIRGLEPVTSAGARLILEGCDFRPVVSRRNLSMVRRLIRDLK